MEWREIASEMPDADETVLLFAPAADPDVWMGYFDGSEWLTVEGRSLTLDGTEPTHWMPLPDPPDGPAPRFSFSRGSAGVRSQDLTGPESGAALSPNPEPMKRRGKR